MVVTDEGIEICFNGEYPLRDLNPIFFMDGGIDIFWMSHIKKKKNIKELNRTFYYFLLLLLYEKKSMRIFSCNNNPRLDCVKESLVLDFV